MGADLEEVDIAVVAAREGGQPEFLVEAAGQSRQRRPPRPVGAGRRRGSATIVSGTASGHGSG
jgi:hypothetical protein